jgi:demethylmenaquinone methyltransferase/2-methoxy-6-polyprenyl-1,4-benzoquinol methylase
VPDFHQAVAEMRRVVRPGGHISAMDFAKPGTPGFKEAYYLYFEKLLPFIGKCAGGHYESYKWLPESLRQFPHQKEVCKVFEGLGLKEVCCHELNGGITAVYVGVK